MPENLPTGSGPKSANSIIQKYVHSAFKLDQSNILDRPIYGTTLYLARCQIDLRFGIFTCYTFQDITHKGYILALAYGDIENRSPLYCRMHSSCVTSETMRGCDCDCSQQLEKALYNIVQRGQGILFYLMQEGRGVGYLAKSRDRMLVQATNDDISTFQAYNILGLKKDYREYQNVTSILKILNLTPKIVLFTNNPDKVAALKELGIEVVGTQRIELDPGPFNLAYLTSKQHAGHILKKTEDVHVESVQPPEPIQPFKPHALPGAQRFVYVASYFLPIRPVHGEVVLNEAEFKGYFTDERPIESLLAAKDPLLHSYTYLRGQRFLIKINKRNLASYKHKHPDDPLADLLTTPYWFKVHVYSDVVSGDDYVVLTYGHPQSYDRPVVRLHSESLFNRFPLKDTANRDKFNASVQEIVRYGCGVIVLLYNDGRGAGFGAYAEDMMLKERGFTHDTTESYNQLGISYDRRDYNAAVALLKHHLPHPKIQMVVNAPRSLVLKPEYTAALNEHQIEVERWIFLKQPV